MGTTSASVNVLPEAMDEKKRVELERCQPRGTPPAGELRRPRPVFPGLLLGVRASWEAIFRTGVCEHAIKELCRVDVSRSVKCEYCGNQRSEQARTKGLSEAQYDDLLNFEKVRRLDRPREGSPGLRGGDHLAASRPTTCSGSWLERRTSPSRAGRAGLVIALTHGPGRAGRGC